MDNGGKESIDAERTLSEKRSSIVRMKRVFLMVGLVFLSLLVLSCRQPEPPGCVPGSTNPCVCTNGLNGAQICKEWGTGYGACVCEPEVTDLGVDVEDSDTNVDDISNTEGLSDVSADIDDLGVDTMEDVGSDVAQDSSIMDADGGSDACSPPLGFTQTQGYSNAYGLQQVVGTGGTGAYRFQLLENASGALLNELTGAYLAGGVTDVTDTILLTDLGCSDEALFTIDVVPPILVQPKGLTVALGASFTFEVSYGSGSYSFELLDDESGSQLSATGLFQAGTEVGNDLVRVLDVHTGQSELATIRVRPVAGITADPPRLMLPLGHSYPVRVQGGSGVLDLVSEGESIAVEGQQITAIATGSGVVHITDHFTGDTAMVTVDVASSQFFPALRVGYLAEVGVVQAGGDIDGGGYLDAVLAVGESTVDWFNSGAVYIYDGNPLGLSPVPVRVISGFAREDRFGNALLVEDINNDGLDDLIVGARLADLNGGSSGAVYIFYGESGHFFSAEPSKVLTGRFGSDEFGRAISVCDYNGDGFPDLAVGTWRSEDRDAEPVRSDQGGVAIYLGSKNGIPETPTRHIWGFSLQPGGTWVGVNGSRLGSALASGDFDGDQICDLAVAILDGYPGGNDQGGVYVYRGQLDGDFSLGGPSGYPNVAMLPPDPNSGNQYFGDRMTVADFDQDGNDDLVVSYRYGIVGDPPQNRAGRVLIWKGGNLTAEIADSWIEPDDFDWEIAGDNPNDYEGSGLAVGDITGDGLVDLVVGSLSNEVSGNPSNTGTVRVFAGQPGALPETEEAMAWVGAVNGDRFGSSVCVLGDVDYSGQEDLLVFGQYDDSYGLNVGQAHFVPADDASMPIDLFHSGEAGGLSYGRSMTFVDDLNSDGWPELVVSADRASVAARYRMGMVWVYTSDGPQYPEEPSQELASFPGHSNADRLGHHIATLSDFDGDGYADLAVVSLEDDRPGSYGDNYATPNDYTASCAGNGNNRGALFIFRGTENGVFENNPAFVFYGPMAGDRLRRVAGIGDMNGDGFSDLVVTSYSWDRPNPEGTGTINSVGGGVLILGREVPNPDKINVICNGQALVLGASGGAQMGWSVTGIGDVNGDGCRDFALGANTADLEASNQGLVYIYYGYKEAPSTCPTELQVAVLAPGAANAGAGYSLAGGGDVDGDTLADLLVGGITFRNPDNVSVGAVWLLPGSYLATITPQPLNDGVVPTQIEPFVPPLSTLKLRLEGTTIGEDFGYSVAFVPDATPDGRDAILVGRRDSDLSGVAEAGAASIFVYHPPEGDGPGGFAQTPLVNIGGETIRGRSQMGHSVATGWTPMGAVLGVGALYGSSIDVDAGSAYIFYFNP